MSFGVKKDGCVILYSGGTDSTCAAALMAKEFSCIHLLTFYQGCKKSVSGISGNINALKNKFAHNIFIHETLQTTRLVKFISYNNYLRYLFKFKLLVLSTCGFTTLSWHIRAIVYCLKNDIAVVADGLTRELLHFPGHMDKVIEVFKTLYGGFGIQYLNPVRNWAVPPDKQFIDRLIIDQHGYLFPGEESLSFKDRTTGRYLYELGIMPNPNVKGSSMDHKMQYDCYPFVLYNIMAFWIYLNFCSYESFCLKMKYLFQDKSADARVLIEEYIANEQGSRLRKLLEDK